MSNSQWPGATRRTPRTFVIVIKATGLTLRQEGHHESLNLYNILLRLLYFRVIYYLPIVWFQHLRWRNTWLDRSRRCNNAFIEIVLPHKSISYSILCINSYSILMLKANGVWRTIEHIPERLNANLNYDHPLGSSESYQVDDSWWENCRVWFSVSRHSLLTIHHESSQLVWFSKKIAAMLDSAFQLNVKDIAATNMWKIRKNTYVSGLFRGC